MEVHQIVTPMKGVTHALTELRTYVQTDHSREAKHGRIADMVTILCTSDGAIGTNAAVRPSSMLLIGIGALLTTAEHVRLVVLVSQKRLPGVNSLI